MEKEYYFFDEGLKEHYEKLAKEFGKVSIDTFKVPKDFLERNGYLEKFSDFFTSEEMKAAEDGKMSVDSFLKGICELDENFSYSYTKAQLSENNGREEVFFLDPVTQESVKIEGIEKDGADEMLKSFRNANYIGGSDESYVNMFECAKMLLEGSGDTRPDIKLETYSDIPSASLEEFLASALERSENLEMVEKTFYGGGDRKLSFKDGKLAQGTFYDAVQKPLMVISFDVKNKTYTVTSEKKDPNFSSDRMKKDLIESADSIAKDFGFRKFTEAKLPSRRM